MHNSGPWLGGSTGARPPHYLRRGGHIFLDKKEKRKKKKRKKRKKEGNNRGENMHKHKILFFVINIMCK